MVQVNTTLPTGIRAFNFQVALPPAGETQLLYIKPGDGGQLKLVEVDGNTSAVPLTVRVYSVTNGGSTPQQIASFLVTVVGAFNQKLKLALGAPDENIAALNVPFNAATSLGMIGQGGIKITGEIAAGGFVNAGATTDRRVDGPYDFVA